MALSSSDIGGMEYFLDLYRQNFVPQGYGLGGMAPSQAETDHIVQQAVNSLPQAESKKLDKFYKQLMKKFPDTTARGKAIGALAKIQTDKGYRAVPEMPMGNAYFQAWSDPERVLSQLEDVADMGDEERQQMEREANELTERERLQKEIIDYRHAIDVNIAAFRGQGPWIPVPELSREAYKMQFNTMDGYPLGPSVNEQNFMTNSYRTITELSKQNNGQEKAYMAYDIDSVPPPGGFQPAPPGYIRPTRPSPPTAAPTAAPPANAAAAVGGAAAAAAPIEPPVAGRPPGQPIRRFERVARDPVKSLPFGSKVRPPSSKTFRFSHMLPNGTKVELPAEPEIKEDEEKIDPFEYMDDVKEDEEEKPKIEAPQDAPNFNALNIDEDEEPVHMQGIETAQNKVDTGMQTDPWDDDQEDEEGGGMNEQSATTPQQPNALDNMSKNSIGDINVNVTNTPSSPPPEGLSNLLGELLELLKIQKGYDPNARVDMGTVPVNVVHGMHPFSSSGPSTSASVLPAAAAPAAIAAAPAAAPVAPAAQPNVGDGNGNINVNADGGLAGILQQWANQNDPRWKIIERYERMLKESAKRANELMRAQMYMYSGRPMRRNPYGMYYYDAQGRRRKRTGHFMSEMDGFGGGGNGLPLDTTPDYYMEGGVAPSKIPFGGGFTPRGTLIGQLPLGMMGEGIGLPKFFKPTVKKRSTLAERLKPLINAKARISRLKDLKKKITIVKGRMKAKSVKGKSVKGKKK